MNSKYNDNHSVGKDQKEVLMLIQSVEYKCVQNDNNLKNPYATDKKGMSASTIIEKERRRLPFKAVDRMDERIIDIPSHDLVHDG